MLDGKAISRRWFFEQCGIGLGRDGASATGCGGDRFGQSACSEEASLCAESEACHLPLHGGCAEPSGIVRLQAAACEVRRDAASRRIC